MKKRQGVKIILGLALLVAALLLLGEDSKAFLIWYLAIGVLGVGFMPLAGRIFRNFEDRGWLFSKIIGIGVCGYVTWVLVTVGVFPFENAVCLVLTLLCLAGMGIWGLHSRKNGVRYLPEGQWDLIFWEEVLLFTAFLLWTYFAGFRPKAYGTEKFMDFGFMAAMMRSSTLPPTDMWYSQAPINYYYGGQYYATFLTRLTFTKVADTYNLMRTMLAGFAFVLPFSLVRQLFRDKVRLGENRVKDKLCTVSGLLAGAFVSLAGNMHYVIYALVLPWLKDKGLISIDLEDYWFPSATRYIGHDPLTDDKTIHEFPSYSFVLGDLHAHVVDIIFVLLMIGILYAWMQNVFGRCGDRKGPAGFSVRRELLQLPLLCAGVLLGIYQWSNFWDFVIYFVVAGGVILFTNIRKYSHSCRLALAAALMQALGLLAVEELAALPFTLQFTSMVQGVALAQNHSRFYQLCVLWALPVTVVLAFILRLVWKYRKDRLTGFFRKVKAPDLFVLILGLCALGLVLIPELVYVRDIYEQTSARSNTMFKLTYQAFIMFGMCMAYILTGFVFYTKSKCVRSLGILGLALSLLTTGYIGNAVNAWFGDVLQPEGYRGLDATAFLEEEFPQDASAIRWLMDHVEGNPVVLEANGDSYTEYERVSAMTGLPTVLGWYVHEWLWRQDVPDINQKAADIETIYTSTDRQEVKRLLNQYEVQYVFIGSTEEDKYSNLNRMGLMEMGEVVFADEAVIVKMA